MWQKQKIKRQYAKAAREAKKAGKCAKDTAVTTEKIAAGVVHAIKRHPVICGIVILLLLVFFLITSLFSSFSMTPEDLLKADYPVLFEGGGT